MNDINKPLSETQGRIIALAGNPNVGKSTLFNSLTGMRQHTGNWTGKTVGIAEGECKKGEYPIKLVDLPGTYSLNAHSEEERVARDYICSGEAAMVAVICDATCLERNLILTLQILELTHSAVVCVNLIDEAEKKGIHIDIEVLQKELSVPVVAISARSGKGLDEALRLFCCNENDLFKASESRSCGQSYACLAEKIAKEAVSYTKDDHMARDRKIDKILTSKMFGFPIMLLMLAVIFWITIEGANIPSSVLSWLFFKIEEWLVLGFNYVSAPWWLTGALIYGVYRTVAWVVSVMLPPMAIFFPLFTILEDLGYLPRVAFNLDRCFKCCNACGKQALTM